MARGESPDWKDDALQRAVFVINSDKKSLLDACSLFQIFDYLP